MLGNFSPQAERGKKRLAFLLKQAEVFQHFAPTASDIGKKCALFSCQAHEQKEIYRLGHVADFSVPVQSSLGLFGAVAPRTGPNRYSA